MRGVLRLGSGVASWSNRSAVGTSIRHTSTSGNRPDFACTIGALIGAHAPIRVVAPLRRPRTNGEMTPTVVCTERRSGPGRPGFLKRASQVRVLLGAPRPMALCKPQSRFLRPLRIAPSAPFYDVFWSRLVYGLVYPLPGRHSPGRPRLRLGETDLDDGEDVPSCQRERLRGDRAAGRFGSWLIAFPSLASGRQWGMGRLH